MKDINLLISQIQQIPSKINKKSTTRNTVLKLSFTKDRNHVLKANRNLINELSKKKTTIRITPDNNSNGIQKTVKCYQ